MEQAPGCFIRRKIMIIIKTDNFIKTAIVMFKNRYKIKDGEIFKFIIPESTQRKFRAYFEGITLYTQEYSSDNQEPHTTYFKENNVILFRLLFGEFKVLFNDFIPKEDELYYYISDITLDAEGKTVKQYQISCLGFKPDNMNCLTNIISGNCFAQEDFITMEIVQEYYDRYRKLVNKNERK